MKKFQKRSNNYFKNKSINLQTIIKIILTTLIVAYIYHPLNLFALSEGKPSFLTFSSFSIVSDSTLSAGDTIILQLIYLDIDNKQHSIGYKFIK